METSACNMKAELTFFRDKFQEWSVWCLFSI